jgi:nicotinamidase-related amidase
MSLALDPASTALLVMDYQSGLVQRLADSPALLDLANAAIGDVRSRGAHVGWVRVGFTDADFDAIPPTSAMARAVTPERQLATSWADPRG